MFGLVPLELVQLSSLPSWEENVCQSPQKWMQHEWRLYLGGGCSREADRLWHCLPLPLRDLALSSVRESHVMELQVEEVRREMPALLRRAFTPESVDFITALYVQIKPLFASVNDFDCIGEDCYSSKIQACFDPDER